MHRTPLPKLFILFVIYAYLLMATVFGQTKPSDEIDVTKCWSYPLGAAVGSLLALDAHRVFLGLDGAKVEALSLDGKRVWSSELGGEITSNILSLDGGLFLVTSTVSNAAGKPGEIILRSLSKETGITNWTLKLPDAGGHFLGGFKDAVIAVSISGVIQSIDAKSGAVRWKREIAEGFIGKPVFNGSRVLAATTGNQIFAVSLMTGEIDSMRKVPFAVTALVEMASGGIVVGDERGNVLLLMNGTDKPYWKFKSGGEISTVSAVGDRLLVTSHDNFVYFLVSGNGGRVWKKRMAGRVSRIATYADSYALISNFEEHGAVLVDIANGKISGRMAFGGTENIASDPVISNGLIFVLTNQAAYAFALNGCPINKEGGTDKSP